MPTLNFNDFNGGVTESPIDCNPTQYEQANNFLITQDKKLEPRYGSSRDSTSASLVPGSVTRIGALISFRDIIFKQRVNDLHYVQSGVMSTLVGPTGNAVYPSATVSNIPSWGLWNMHFMTVNDDPLNRPQKVFLNTGGNPVLLNLGLPILASAPNVVLTAGGSSLSYLYKFFYKHTYVREGNVTFEETGQTSATLTVASAGAAAIAGGAPASITVIPVLANGLYDNFATTEITVQIYRTANAGTEYYKVGEVTNGTTTFSDTTADAALLLNDLIYTAGGIAENTQPPQCKSIHCTEQFAYFVNILEGGEILSNEIRQSKANRLYAAPADFSESVDDELVAVSSVRSIPIVFGKNSVYRIDGFFDDFGRGGMNAVKISDTTGCNSPLSIVQTLDALFFAGTDGFYTTDGYKVIKISNQADKIYQQATVTSTQRNRIYGIFQKSQSRIWWALNPSNGVDNDTLFIFDLRFGISSEVPYTNANGVRLDSSYAALSTQWTASSMTYLNGYIYRAQSNGYTMRHDPIAFTDEYINADSLWVQQPIQYDFKSAIFSCANPSVKKFASKVSIVAENVANLSCLIQSDNDKKQIYSNCDVIWVKSHVQWGDSFWGDPILWTGDTEIIKQIRYLPQSGGLRFVYKQIRFKNAYTNISSSDLRSTCAVASGTTVKTLIIPSPKTFPPDCTDYYISVENTVGSGIYSNDLLILSNVDSKTITVDDPSQVLTVGVDKRWVIKGFAKGDVLKILSWSLYFENLSSGSLVPYLGELGGNAV